MAAKRAGVSLDCMAKTEVQDDAPMLFKGTLSQQVKHRHLLLLKSEMAEKVAISLNP